MAEELVDYKNNQLTEKDERTDFVERIEAISKDTNRHTNSAVHVLEGKMLSGRKATRTVVVTVFIFFLLAVVWSYFAKLEEVSTARGELVPVATLERLQHLEGGMVQEYFVSKGDVVQKGDIIATLKDESRTSQDTISKNQLLSHLFARERLVALLNARPAEFENVLNDGSDDYQSLRVVHEQLYLSEQALINAEDTFLSGQVESKEKLVESMSNRLLSSEKQLKLIQEQVRMRQTLYDQQTSSYLELVNSQIQEMNMIREIENLQESIMTTEDALIDLRNQWQQTVSARLAKYSAELKLEEDKIQELSQTRRVDTDKTERLVIRSPVYGIIKDLPIKHESAVLEPGGILAEIIPLEEGLKAEVKINPKDIGFVQVGQPVALKFDTYDFTKYGALEGILTNISASTFSEEDEIYYKGDVKLAANNLNAMGGQFPVKPGMEMNADISTGEKRVIEYVVKPVVFGLKEAFRER
ncbi:HlyD family type I secretion periplasmic adaptor subunit [Photobacterium sanctipauli]|uniref:Membrane fusion protein (MFP) family protein n=1 Tax=Photobacterium sanctipauli TaxID=1342794 RepID=A0A2T3NPL0_9GAMM|nr:HlyD family type I secretion periplasmic adaptor subunit [Photobacterium sanctipauli]PSW18216.1 HlyD family type I secretion periplasmic adaptor subunit [Photobacterium sanctipauli]